MKIAVPIFVALAFLAFALTKDSDHIVLPINAQIEERLENSPPKPMAKQPTLRTSEVPSFLSNIQTAEEPEVIARQIAEIQDDLEATKAIERLNSQGIEQKEQQRIGERLRQLDALRAKALQLDINAIHHEVVILEANQNKRLESYGVKL